MRLPLLGSRRPDRPRGFSAPTPPLRARLASGAIVGAAGWLAAMILGIPAILGVGEYAGLVVAALVGAALGPTRLRRLPWTFAGLMLTVVLLVAYTPVAAWLVRSVVRPDPPGGPAPDAIVVLSSGLSGDGYLDVQGTDRLLSALALAREGVAPRLVVSRVRGAEGRVSSDADQRRLVALLGDAAPPVYVVDSVESTRDEAVRVRDLAAREGWRRVVLVTSALHTRRACAVFRRLALAVRCHPADSRDVALVTMGSPADRTRAFGLWLYEVAATLYYRWRGWL